MKRGIFEMIDYNELEFELENINTKVIRVSKEIYKAIKKDKKEIEKAYNIKIKKRK